MRHQAGPGAGQHAATAGREVVRFAGFQLDPRSGELWNNGTRHTLGEQPLEVLLALIEHPGQLVTREELRQRLWPGDTFVDFEHGLNAAVKRLRDALEDSADTPRFIETLPRHGYRFIARLESCSGAGDAHDLEILGVNRSVRIVLSLLLMAAAGSAAWMGLQYFKRANPPSVTAQHATRVTFDPGLQTDPTLSSDGRFIAYASDKTGNFDIWVKQVSGGEAKQVTRSPAQDTQPDWSPVAATLVFSRTGHDGGGLMVVRAFGGPERPLTSFGARPRWSSDGTQILFLSTEHAQNGIVPDLFVVPAAGGTPKQILKSFVSRLAAVDEVRWHPDGRHVSLVAAPPDERQAHVFTIDVDGGSPQDWQIRRAKGLPQSIGIISAEWDSSGRIVYLLTAEPRRLQPSRDIWRVTVDPERHEGLTAQCLTSGESVYANQSVAYGGKQIAFTSVNELTHMWAFPLAASGHADEQHGERVSPAGARQADLARDERSLLFTLPASRGEGTELWLTDLATGATRSAGAFQPNHWAYPRWSRDARNVAYWSVRMIAPESRDAEQGLAVWRRDSREHTLIMTPLREIAAPRGQRLAVPSDWAADGQSILASSDLATPTFSLGLWSLAKAPFAEKAVTTLAFHKDYNLWQGRFSPDDRWIAFVAQKYRDPGVATVAVMPSAGADASRWRVITDQHEWTDKPRWSADGNVVYYLRAKGGFYNVWAQRFDTRRGTPVGPPVQITDLESPAFHVSPDLGAFEPCVSTRRLIVPISETTGSIWVMDRVDR